MLALELRMPFLLNFNSLLSQKCDMRVHSFTIQDRLAHNILIALTNFYIARQFYRFNRNCCIAVSLNTSSACAPLVRRWNSVLSPALAHCTALVPATSNTVQHNARSVDCTAMFSSGQLDSRLREPWQIQPTTVFSNCVISFQFLGILLFEYRSHAHTWILNSMATEIFVHECLALICSRFESVIRLK